MAKIIRPQKKHWWIPSGYHRKDQKHCTGALGRVTPLEWGRSRNQRPEISLTHKVRLPFLTSNPFGTEMGSFCVRKYIRQKEIYKVHMVYWKACVLRSIWKRPYNKSSRQIQCRVRPQDGGPSPIKGLGVGRNSQVWPHISRMSLNHGLTPPKA